MELSVTNLPDEIIHEIVLSTNSTSFLLQLSLVSKFFYELFFKKKDRLNEVFWLKECFVVKNVPSYVKDRIDIDIVSTSIEKFNGSAMTICKDLCQIPKFEPEHDLPFLLFDTILRILVKFSRPFELMLVDISTTDEKTDIVIECLYRKQNPEILSYLLSPSELSEYNFNSFFAECKAKYDDKSAATFLVFQYHRKYKDLTDYIDLFDKDLITFTKFMFPVVYGLIDENRTGALIDKIFSLHPKVYGFLNEESLYALQYITNPNHLQIALLASARGNPDVLKLLLDRGISVNSNLLKQRYIEAYYQHSKPTVNGRVIPDFLIRRRLERCSKILDEHIKT